MAMLKKKISKQKKEEINLYIYGFYLRNKNFVYLFY